MPDKRDSGKRTSEKRQAGLMDEAGLEALLRQALSAPEPDSARRRAVRRGLLQRHPAASDPTGRGSAGRGLAGEAGPVGDEGKRAVMGSRVDRREAEARRVRTRNWKIGLGLAAVAVLAGLTLALWPMLFGTAPIAQFGPLPSLASGLRVEDFGASGGPGYEFDLDYRLSEGLVAGWPGLPAQETVYKQNPFDFTEAHAQALAAALGITAPVVKEGWHDSYLFAADAGDGGPSLRVFPDGGVIFTRPFDYTPVDPTSLPESGRAVQIAREWLAAKGFVPSGEGILNAGLVEYQADQGLVMVTFRPARPGDVVTIVPYAAVQLDQGGNVVIGQASWLTDNVTSPYPLRGVAEAWNEVVAGGGILKMNYLRDYLAPSSDAPITGPAVVDGVRVAWALTTAADGTPYLQPVYVFSGVTELPVEGGGSIDLPFEVWTAAVAEDHIAE